MDFNYLTEALRASGLSLAEWLEIEADDNRVDADTDVLKCAAELLAADVNRKVSDLCS